MSPKDLNIDNDLIGGIRNALDRGTDIVSAQKSFINAGYSAEEVSLAAQNASTKTVVISSQVSTYNKLPASSPNITKKKSKKFILIVSILSALLLTLGVLAIVFWRKLF